MIIRPNVGTNRLCADPRFHSFPTSFKSCKPNLFDSFRNGLCSRSRKIRKQAGTVISKAKHPERLCMGSFGH